MDMAKRTARLLTERLRHSNGLPVECVMADTCIGGVAEAARTEEKFSRENVGLTISVTLLVLSNGNDGYASDKAESHLGI